MKPPLDALSLRLFVAVCEQGSLARAAAQEAMVSSALSKRMAALEATLGVPLLLRRRRGVHPTPAGEALLRQSREVLSGMDRLRAELGAFALGAQGSVRVLACSSVLAQSLPDDLAVFRACEPGVNVVLAECASPDILRNLHEGTADVGVLWDQADLRGLQAHRYRSDLLCVATAPDHPLARCPSLRFEETLEFPSLSVAPGSLLDGLLSRQAALLGRVQMQCAQVSSMDAACRIVAAGLGLAIVPREAATPHAAAGRLRLVPLEEPWADRQFVVCARTEPLLSASTRLLIAHLHAVGG